MTVREGRWDCQYCATTGILGRHKVCPNCAKSRPEGTKFYLPEDEQVVDSTTLKEQASLGPDWICEFCSSSNPSNLEVCRHCNAPREGGGPQQAVKEYALGAAPRSGDMTLPDPHEKYRAARPPAKKERPRWLLPAIGVFILVICLLGGLALFRSDAVDVTVDEISWERSVVVEQLQTITEEDWELPEGGRIISQQEEIHHYDQVVVGYQTKERQVSERVQVGERIYVCGERDLGNGFFEDVECTEPVYETQQRTETYEDPVYEQVPVYATKYTFEIDRWVATRTEQVAGNDGQAFWPELTLAPGEREGAHEEEYRVVFRSADGERYEMTFEEEEWRTFESRGRYKLRVNGLGQAVGVES